MWPLGDLSGPEDRQCFLRVVARFLAALQAIIEREQERVEHRLGAARLFLLGLIEIIEELEFRFLELSQFETRLFVCSRIFVSSLVGDFSFESRRRTGRASA